jgi:transglutaminase-like putative cysteine protease
MSKSSEPRQLQNPALIEQLRQRIVAMPLPEAEDSIPLRVLTQALVIVGIVATDVVASTQNSFWAIPASILGAVWSWYRRRQRNIPTKFCLAIGMLLTLAAFLLRLAGELNDTRLALAELLIQLQVLHSFDLPRRKDLGYSMVIGLILLGVAGTLSQTLSFGGLLFLFLTIALPVLVLDYRSRLGLIPRSFKFKGLGISPKQFGVFLLVILSMGLTIFALLPRFPGYQLRTFPVSAPIELQGKFDNRQIVNPGYANPGATGTGAGGTATGQGQGTGAGKLDETFYYGFSNQINQNLRGKLKPQVVMRVRSQAEGFWRVLAFDRYTGQGWELSRNDQAQTLNRSRWSYQFFLPRPVTLNKTREVVQTYTVVADLPNLLPALSVAKELYYPTQEVAIDPEGGLRSPVRLVDGLTYTVVSEVPYRNRTILRTAPTRYPSAIRNFYLSIPSEIAAKVRQQTEKILATSPKPITAPYEQALFLAQALKQRYSLQEELPFLEENEDLVEAFLFKHQGGYADHFSTVLTVMLRSIGIPARLSVGFAPGDFNPFTGLYVVRNTDAYALTEVYFPKYGWFAFDPIPGHPLLPPSIEEDQTFSVLRKFWQWVAGWLPSPVTSALGRVVDFVVSWAIRVIGWVLVLFSRGWVGLFTGLVGLIGVAFALWLGWRGWLQWRHHRRLAKLPPMERLYQQMLDRLMSWGFRKHPSQTPLEYARQMQQHQTSTHAAIIEEISRAYVRWRYGGDKPMLDRLQKRLQELKKQPHR